IHRNSCGMPRVFFGNVAHRSRKMWSIALLGHLPLFLPFSIVFLLLISSELLAQESLAATVEPRSRAQTTCNVLCTTLNSRQNFSSNYFGTSWCTPLNRELSL